MTRQQITAMKYAPEVYEWSKQASILSDMGKLHDALPLLERALAVAPFDADLLCQVSAVYIKQSEWDKGLTSADKALGTNPISDTAYRLRCVCLRHAGRLEEALDAARHAARIRPNHAVTLFTLGTTLRLCSNYKEAETVGKQLLEIAPEEALTHLLLANLYTSISQWLDVERHARIGLQNDAENAPLYRLLGNSLLQQQRFGNAAQAYLAALRIEPTHRQAQIKFRESCLRFSLNFLSPAHIAIATSVVLCFFARSMGFATALCVTMVLVLFVLAALTTLPPAAWLRLQPAYYKLPIAARHQMAHQCRIGWKKEDFMLAGVAIAGMLFLIVALLITHP